MVNKKRVYNKLVYLLALLFKYTNECMINMTFLYIFPRKLCIKTKNPQIVISIWTSFTLVRANTLGFGFHL